MFHTSPVKWNPSSVAVFVLTGILLLYLKILYNATISVPVYVIFISTISLLENRDWGMKCWKLPHNHLSVAVMKFSCLLSNRNGSKCSDCRSIIDVTYRLSLGSLSWALPPSLSSIATTLHWCKWVACCAVRCVFLFVLWPVWGHYSKKEMYYTFHRTLPLKVIQYITLTQK